MLNKDINKTIDYFKDKLAADDSFDLIYRSITINKRTAAIFFTDGLVKDEIMEKILEFFYSIDDDSMMTDAHTFSKNCIPYIEVDIKSDDQDIITGILSGVTALFIDGFDSALMLDTRSYPQRETAEPEKDKSMRGARDGFVETIVFNTALIRRRIRDKSLRIRAFNVGTESKTDIAVCYMDGKADKKLLAKLIDKIKSTDVKSLTMPQQSFVEAIYKNKWYNPFPKVKHTERPDTAASAITEGNIVILIDNSPSALILPTSIFDIFEQVDDYCFPPITGTYLRLSRFMVSLATLLLTPTWLLALQNPTYVPGCLKFIVVDEQMNIPIFWQLILLEIIIDGLKLASLNTPDVLSTSLSIIGGIAFSEFAVDSGWFAKEAILYMAFVAISNYTQSNYELGYALKFMRIILLITTFAMNFIGYIAGLILIFILLLCNKTVSGKSYLYPLIPFRWSKLKRRIFRLSLKTE